MNKVALIGRLTRDPEIRYTKDNIAIASYTLAIDRKYAKEGQQSADFINCKVFGKGADFVERYLKQGVKIAVAGRLQSGSYTDKDGRKVYTTDVIVEEHEFAESKKEGTTKPRTDTGYQDATEFMYIPDSIQEKLPFA